jgi:hypothetical protein
MKKRELNQKRKRICLNQNDSVSSDQSSQSADQSTQPHNKKITKDDTALISYLRNTIGLLEHRRVSHEEIEVFINDVRQRGIESLGFYSYINKKENKQSP